MRNRFGAPTNHLYIAAACLCLALIAPGQTTHADSAQRLEALRALDDSLEAAPDKREIRTIFDTAYGYLTGEGGKGNVVAGVAMMEDLADQGVPQAQYVLGLVYSDPSLRQLDFDRAVRMLRRAAGQDFPPAYAALADLYRGGAGGVSDPEEAWRLYEKASRESGKIGTHGTYGMAVMLLEGIAVGADEARGLSLLEEAVAAGHPPAELVMGRIHLTGDVAGSPDFEEAARWLERALANGVSGAALDLGRLYETGQGRPEDARKAAELYRRAADAGIPEAQVRLARLYEEGRGVERDVDMARKLYESAAARGVTAADASPLPRSQQASRQGADGDGEREGVCAAPGNCQGDPRLYGYWYLVGEDGSTSFDESYGAEALHVDGRLATIPRMKSGDMEPSTGTRMEVEGSVARFRYHETAEAPDGRFSFAFQDDDTVVFSNDEGDFVYKRMPADKHLHAALLRLALTGEVESYRRANAEDFFGDAETVLVDLRNGDDRVALVHMPGARFKGALRRDGTAWGIPLGANVMAFALRQGQEAAYFERVAREAAQPIAPRR
ncbi:tetratricopeptide repeat protein [Ferruginivarius sediminum]|uniref:tetratricopeptide repeat protein n=1 Tax=Ferruginivarius sediminum TaxID=2661937 RepID=UPI0011C02CA0|nr:tetratricopeptide repeat protein [Ferruginivarius sediminum]